MFNLTAITILICYLSKGQQQTAVIENSNCDEATDFARNTLNADSIISLTEIENT